MRYRFDPMDSSLEASISDGLKAQQAASRELLDSGAKRLGWKAGFGTAAAIEKLGTDGPLVGFLTDSTLAPSGTTIDVAGWEKPVLETEVSLRLDADVEAGQGREEIRAAIGAIGAAIELVDLGQAGSDPGAILATNIFHRKVLLGDWVTLAADRPLDEVRIDVLSDGEPHASQADPADVLGDLIDVLAGLADLLAGSDDGLRAGDVIITGAAIKPFELSGGETVEVRVAGSTVSATIA
jgi:2-keto-4-pentenoate hydratase